MLKRKSVHHSIKWKLSRLRSSFWITPALFCLNYQTSIIKFCTPETVLPKIRTELHRYRMSFDQPLYMYLQGFWQALSPTRKETSYSDRIFWFSYVLFIIIIDGILLLFIYIKRLASNKIHREVGRAKDLSAPLYVQQTCIQKNYTASTCRKITFWESIQLWMLKHLYLTIFCSLFASFWSLMCCYVSLFCLCVYHCLSRPLFHPQPL